MKKLLSILTLMLLVIIAKAQSVPEYKVVDTFYELTYTSYIINYTSAGPDGDPATVSGAITVPGLLGKPGLWVMDSHHTVSDNASTPSTVGSSTAGSMVVGALAVVIAPDYYGYGVTKDQKHPYMSQWLNARNSLDLLKVALDMLPKEGQNPLMLCNLGYSQGAGVAMAAQNLMENDEAYADIIPSFSKGVYTWCGDGPYDPMTTAKENIYGNPDKVIFPALLPHIVNGFLCSGPKEDTAGLKFSDFFTDAMAGLEKVVAAKDKNNDALNAWMIEAAGGSAKLSDFFSADMCSMDAPLFKKMKPWLEANSVCTGWTPKNPMFIYHLVEDDIVSYANAELAVKNLGIPEKNFFAKHASEYDFDPTKEKHSAFAPSFFAAFGIQGLGIYSDVTGIDVIEAKQHVLNAPSYNLQGQKVDNNYRGFVIQNGKKILIR